MMTPRWGPGVTPCHASGAASAAVSPASFSAAVSFGATPEIVLYELPARIDVRPDVPGYDQLVDVITHVAHSSAARERGLREAS